MTQDEETVFAIRGVIASLPEEQRKECESILQMIRQIVDESPVAAILAVALIGAEQQAAG